MKRRVAVSLPILLTSCATIMGGGGPWHVPIDSVPQGAVVAYDGANVGVTPCTVTMRSQSSRLTLKRDGYHDQIVEAGRSANAMLIGNVLFGGLVGLVVDTAAGSAMKISTAPCWVEMTPAGDPRPGVWMRPPPPLSVTPDDEGWVRAGQSAPDGASMPSHKPTRAPRWIEPPPKPVHSDDEGWVRYGDGR